MAEAVALAEALEVITNVTIIKNIEDVLWAEYQRTNKEKENYEGQALYGLLGGQIAPKAVEHKAEFQNLAEIYFLPDLSGINNQKLFVNGVNVQRYFFYNDKDGRGSFESFVKAYRNNPNWRIIDHKFHIEIQSRKGKRVVIIANKPAFDELDVQQIIDSQGYAVSLFVHRGHSYHVDKSLRRMTPTALLTFLGSCGGYNNIVKVLNNFPSSHILSTKGTGTRWVNDPLLFMINEEIRKGRDIEWANIWQNAEQKMSWNENFPNYIPPHKNLGVLFYMAYTQHVQRLKAEAEKQGSSPILGEGGRKRADIVAGAGSIIRQTENPGGIDLNPDMLDLQTQDDSIEYDIPLDSQTLETIPINGFSPVIYQIVPVNLQMLIGSSEAVEGQQHLSLVN